jgi:hypothetical protein
MSTCAGRRFVGAKNVIGSHTSSIAPWWHPRQLLSSNSRACPGSTTIAGAGTSDRALALAGDGIDVDSDLVSDAVLGDADFGRRLVRGYGKSVRWLVSVMSADALPSSPPMVVELESTDWGCEPCKEILVSRTWPAPTLLVVWKANDGRPTSARREREVLVRLARAGCRVPKCLGFYRWVGSRNDRLLLATIFCGQPVLSFSDLSLDQRCERLANTTPSCPH